MASYFCGCSVSFAIKHARTIVQSWNLREHLFVIQFSFSLSLQHQIVVGGLGDKKKTVFLNFFAFYKWSKNFFPLSRVFSIVFLDCLVKKPSNQSKVHGDILICLQTIRFIGSDLVNRPPCDVEALSRICYIYFEVFKLFLSNYQE